MCQSNVSLVAPFQLLLEQVCWVRLLRNGGSLTDHRLVKLQLLFLDVRILFYEAVKAEFFTTDVDHDLITSRNNCDLLGSISVIVSIISTEHFDNLVFVGEIV